jgi:hypothetical protein
MKSPWFWLVVSGAALMVPVPFLDDYLSRRALRRAIVADTPEGHPLPASALDALTADRESMLLGCLRTAIVWPIKKLFKTIFWFFTAKDILDRIAWSGQVFVNARVARARGWLPEHATLVRDATDATFQKFRWSPVTRPLMRYERPPLPSAGAGLAGLVTWLRRHAGGALLDADFLTRAEGLR